MTTEELRDKYVRLIAPHCVWDPDEDPKSHGPYVRVDIPKIESLLYSYLNELGLEVTEQEIKKRCLAENFSLLFGDITFEDWSNVSNRTVGPSGKYAETTLEGPVLFPLLRNHARTFTKIQKEKTDDN